MKESLCIPDEANDSKRNETKGADIVGRRRFLFASAGILCAESAVLAHPGVRDFLHCHILYPDIARTCDLLANAPVSDVRTLDTPIPGAGTHFIRVSRDGTEVVSHAYLHRQQTLDALIDSRQRHPAIPVSRAAHPSVPDQTAFGSCFIVRDGQRRAVVTNQHVLRMLPETHEKQVFLDDSQDIGVVPAAVCRGAKGDTLASMSVDGQCKDGDLHGEEVSIYGMGARLFEIRGRAIRLPPGVVHHGLDNFYVGKFALKIDPAKHIDPGNIVGMSGSPVVHVTTGRVVGVFHTIFAPGDIRTTSSNVHRIQIASFSGPEALRSALHQSAC